MKTILLALLISVGAGVAYGHVSGPRIVLETCDAISPWPNNLKVVYEYAQKAITFATNPSSKTASPLQTFMKNNAEQLHSIAKALGNTNPNHPDDFPVNFQGAKNELASGNWKSGHPQAKLNEEILMGDLNQVCMTLISAS